jgi:hypothetical protein
MVMMLVVALSDLFRQRWPGKIGQRHAAGDARRKGRAKTA